jgi:hypothetical protein
LLSLQEVSQNALSSDAVTARVEKAKELDQITGSNFYKAQWKLQLSSFDWALLRIGDAVH